MRCREVRKRVVPYQDGELAPAEMQQVGEHLAHCPDCERQARRLAQVTPQARLVVPPEVQARLHARVSGPVLRAIAAERPAPARTPWRRLLGWFNRDAEVPVGALLVYGAMLAVALAWGMSNWWTVTDLEARLAASPSQRIDSQHPIPAEQYRPASWSPAADGEHPDEGTQEVGRER